MGHLATPGTASGRGDVIIDKTSSLLSSNLHARVSFQDASVSWGFSFDFLISTNPANYFIAISSAKSHGTSTTSRISNASSATRRKQKPAKKKMNVLCKRSMPNAGSKFFAANVRLPLHRRPPICRLNPGLDQTESPPATLEDFVREGGLPGKTIRIEIYDTLGRMRRMQLLSGKS